MSYGEKFYEKVDAFENQNGKWFWTAILYGLAAIIERLDELLRLARQVDVEDHQ